MPTTDTESVISAIVTLLRASLTHYNLSTVNTTPRVDIGEVVEPPIPDPYVAIWLQPGGHTPEYRTLSSYRHTIGLAWRAFLPRIEGEGDTPTARHTSAMRIGADIVEAIQDGHNDAGNAALFGLDGILVTVDNVEGTTESQIPGSVVVNGSIEYVVSNAGAW